MSDKEHVKPLPASWYNLISDSVEDMTLLELVKGFTAAVVRYGENSIQAHRFMQEFESIEKMLVDYNECYSDGYNNGYNDAKRKWLENENYQINES